MRLEFAVALAIVCGCVAHPGRFGNNAAIDAAVGTAIGLTAAGVSRAGGGCYASCPPGTTCNAATGFCDELPCRGLCSAEEHCEMTPTAWKCMPGRSSPLDIQIGRTPSESQSAPPGEVPRESVPQPNRPGESHPN